MGRCELCNRGVAQLTRHHLIPKQRGGKHSKVVLFCMACKDQIHLLFTNKELAKEYNTLEKILELIT